MGILFHPRVALFSCHPLADRDAPRLNGATGIRSRIRPAMRARPRVSCKGVLLRRLPLAAWASCPAWSPKAAQHIMYIAVRSTAQPSIYSIQSAAIRGQQISSNPV